MTKEEKALLRSEKLMRRQALDIVRLLPRNDQDAREVLDHCNYLLDFLSVKEREEEPEEQTPKPTLTLVPKE